MNGLMRTAATHGNSIGVSICGNATAYEQNLGSSNQTVTEDAKGSTTVKVDDGTAFSVGDLISFSSADASSDATFTFNANDEGNEYEITAINTHDLTVRLKDDPNGAGLQQSFQTIVSFVDAGGSMTSLTVRRELLSGQLITVAVLVMNFTLLSTIQLVTSLVLM